MHAIVGSQNRGTARRKCKANKIVTRHCQRRRGSRRDLYDATSAIQRRCHVQVVINIDRQSLRPSQAAVKNANLAMWIDFVNGIEAGSRWAGNKEVAITCESEVIG